MTHICKNATSLSEIKLNLVQNPYSHGQFWGPLRLKWSQERRGKFNHYDDIYHCHCSFCFRRALSVVLGQLLVTAGQG